MKKILKNIGLVVLGLVILVVLGYCVFTAGNL